MVRLTGRLHLFKILHLFLEDMFKNKLHAIGCKNRRTTSQPIQNRWKTLILIRKTVEEFQEMLTQLKLETELEGKSMQNQANDWTKY